VSVHRWRGAAAVTLRSGGLEATFLPELNMLGTSLALGGEEFLSVPGGIRAYQGGHTTGLPLLAPWANRLGGLRYRCGGVRVDLEGLPLHVDGNGLPIHGTMSAREAWEIVSLSTRGRSARLHARFDYGRPDLLAAFPFPHRIETVAEVDGRSLTITTALTPAGRRSVPVSFGYHPYFRLPHRRRSDWRLRLPERLHLELDERGIPTGVQIAARAEAEPIGARTFDDLFELGARRTLSIETDERRLSVEYGSGYRYAQVFAPPGRSFVCLEPMTAPTNALGSGGCRLVTPGETFTARFRIRPERTTGSR
jgi:galactose mutarotase-like enzyme